MKIQKVYKVVRENLFSARASSWDDENYAVQYLVDTWVQPKKDNTKLFAFKTFEAARDFKHGREIIYLAHALNPRNVQVVCNNIFLVSRFWEAFESLEEKRRIKLTDFEMDGDVRIVPGTIMCDKIKLIKRVE